MGGSNAVRMVIVILFGFLVAMAVMASILPAAAWDYSRRSIPVEEIQSGGPPKDGIPALFDPEFAPAREADFMRDDEKVLGFEIKGVARAYPLRILSHHELVNDQVGGEPILVSW